MRVLLISVGDQAIRQPASGVADRLNGYAARVERLVQLTYSPAAHGCRPTRLGPRLVAYPTRSANRFTYLADAMALGARLLREGGFDLIETQEPVATGLVGIELGRRFRVPVVIGLHNEFFGGSAWQTESPRNLLELCLARWTVARADGVRAVSNAIARSVAALGVPHECVGVAPVPIDRGLYQRGRDLTPAARGWTSASPGVAEPRDEARLLFVGRIAWQKDVPLILRALARLKRAGLAARLDVIGSGPELARCRALARSLELEASVTFHGPLEPADLSHYYWQCDVFVSPARYEGYGRVFAEAALHGAAAVGTRVGGVPEVVEDGETGLLVEAGDESGLTTALEALIRDPVRARGLGYQAWRLGIERFDPEHQSDAIIALWRNLAALTRG